MRFIKPSILQSQITSPSSPLYYHTSQADRGVFPWKRYQELKTIKSDEEHQQATELISALMGRDLDAGSSDYLDTLIVLVNKYEDEHHGIDESLTPQEALRALMEFNNLTQSDIARIIGSESAVSMFLKGDRDLSKAQIKKLAARFKLDAGVFLA